MVVSETTGKAPLTMQLASKRGFPFMNSYYDKPFLRYDQLISLMRSRNIVISDEYFVTNALSNFSYYKIINGYKDSFLSVAGTDKFLPGTRFEELYALHVLDVSIGNLVLKYILHVENAFKTKLSYLISRKYGVYTDPDYSGVSQPDDYLCRDYYSKRNKSRNNTLRQIKDVLNVSGKPHYRSRSLIHYLNNHNHVPPWILVTSLTLGESIRWYNILNNEDKTSICNSMLITSALNDQDKKEYIRKALELLKEFRNAIAHGSRTFQHYGRSIVPKKQALTLSQSIITESDYDANPYAQKGLYAVITLLIVLLHDEYLIASFYRDLEYTLNPYRAISIHGKTVEDIFGLPKDIIHRIGRVSLNITDR